MSSSIEYGTCSKCNTEAPLTRKYFHYDINCECCVGNKHFEIVKTCQHCEPKPPSYIKVVLTPISID